MLDLMLPHINGFEICKAVKSDIAVYKTPVIIMSTLTNAQDIEKAKEAGATHFIGKPYDLQATLVEINKFLPKKGV